MNKDFKTLIGVNKDFLNYIIDPGNPTLRSLKEMQKRRDSRSAARELLSLSQVMFVHNFFLVNSITIHGERFHKKIILFVKKKRGESKLRKLSTQILMITGIISMIDNDICL